MIHRPIIGGNLRLIQLDLQAPRVGCWYSASGTAAEHLTLEKILGYGPRWNPLRNGQEVVTQQGAKHGKEVVTQQRAKR